MLGIAGALPGLTDQFASKGYCLAGAAPPLFVVTSGGAPSLELADRIAGEEEVHPNRCFVRAGWRNSSRRKRSRGTTSGTWSKVMSDVLSGLFLEKGG